MHGQNDRAVPFERSMQMAEAITESNPFHRLFFDEHTTFGHGEYARAFNKPEFYDWLFQHNKKDSSLYILADHYIDIFPKSPSIHYTIPNEPGLYLSASSEEIPLNDQTIIQEDTLIVEEKSNLESIPLSNQQKKPVNRKPSYYVVKKGDNLSTIAQKTGVSIKALKKLNGLTDKSILRSGMKLKIK
jgi:LysM repeat protein